MVSGKTYIVFLSMLQDTGAEMSTVKYVRNVYSRIIDS